MNHQGISLDSVRESTNEFFKKHWKLDLGEPPSWNEIWSLTGSMPGHDSQGIYALLSSQLSVLYVGVGASLGGGIYTGHGLGARIKRYVCVAKKDVETTYQPKGEWVERGLEKIVTLSFEQEYAYLAYALEAYLLREFSPPFNKIRSARVKNA